MNEVSTPKQSKSIDGITYTTQLFPTTDGLILMAKLGDLLGETGLAVVIGAATDPSKSLAGEASLLAPMLGNIASRAAENDGLLVIKDLLRYTKCDKIKIGSNEVTGSAYDHFDDHFQGRYMHLMRVAVWVARASFVGP